VAARAALLALAEEVGAEDFEADRDLGVAKARSLFTIQHYR
jgi:hypothetical protein